MSEEKKCLKELLIIPYTIGILAKRVVCKDYHITGKSSYYSVPYKYVGKLVEVHIREKLISILHETKKIAMHTTSEEKKSFITKTGYYNKYKLFNYESIKYRSSY